MKKLLLGLVLGLGIASGVSVFAQTDETGTSTQPVVFPPPVVLTDAQIISNLESDLTDKNNLVSKYAQLYDGCKNYQTRIEAIKQILNVP